MELKLQTVVPTCAVTADERREVHYQHKHECRAAQWLSGYGAAKESTCWCATRFLFHNKLHTNVDQNRMKTLTLTVADLAQNKNTKEPTPNERCCHTCSTNTSVFFLLFKAAVNRWNLIINSGLWQQSLSHRHRHELLTQVWIKLLHYPCVCWCVRVNACERHRRNNSVSEVERTVIFQAIYPPVSRWIRLHGSISPCLSVETNTTFKLWRDWSRFNSPHCSARVESLSA